MLISQANCNTFRVHQIDLYISESLESEKYRRPEITRYALKKLPGIITAVYYIRSAAAATPRASFEHTIMITACEPDPPPAIPLADELTCCEGHIGQSPIVSMNGTVFSRPLGQSRSIIRQVLDNRHFQVYLLIPLTPTHLLKHCCQGKRSKTPHHYYLALKVVPRCRNRLTNLYSCIFIHYFDPIEKQKQLFHHMNMLVYNLLFTIRHLLL